MAQQFLDHPQIRSAFEQMRGERVAQQMGINVLVDACEFRPLLHDLPHPVRRERAAADAEENV